MNNKLLTKLMLGAFFLTVFAHTYEASKLDYNWSSSTTMSEARYMPSLGDIYNMQTASPSYESFTVSENYTTVNGDGDKYNWIDKTADELTDVTITFNDIIDTPDGESVSMIWKIEEVFFYADDGKSNFQMIVYDDYIDFRTKGFEYLIYSTEFVDQDGNPISVDGSLYVADIDYGQYHGSMDATDYYVVEDTWLEAQKMTSQNGHDLTAFSYADTSDNTDEEAALVTVFQNKSKMYNIWGMSGYTEDYPYDDWSDIYDAETFFFDYTFSFTSAPHISKDVEFDGRLDVFGEGDGEDNIAKYTITLDNSTENYAYDINVRDNLYEETPDYIDFSDVTISQTSDTYTGDLADGNLTFDSIAPGETITLTYEMKLTEIPEGVREITNYALILGIMLTFVLKMTKTVLWQLFL